MAKRFVVKFELNDGMVMGYAVYMKNPTLVNEVGSFLAKQSEDD